ncbi:MAG: homoserine dehydrogenase [Epulopiscium sp.]|nr:homoserine dehydrogenase [Candidatus Epulonipiscium sp.]
MVQIAVLGYGTVGSGVLEVLQTNGESINKRAGKEIKVKYVLDRREFPGDPVSSILVHDIEPILKDPEVKVIVEVMGGVEPAYTFVKRALLDGKSVVTSNKELVAKHGAELLQIAKEKDINFLFEASVGGGIPIIRPLNQSLTADEIYEITGILNGTTNFILTKMKEEGLSFETVLKEAQDLGYAERNPEADVEGHDACRKIAILSSLAFGMHVDYEDIYTEGITKISQADMAYAAKMDREIKLVATSKKQEKEVWARVSPVLLRMDHPLSTVHGVFNAIFVKGNVIGDVMFYGKGAGKLPTASAVVADIVDAVKHLNRNIMSFWSTQKMELLDISYAPTQYFIRIGYTDLSLAIGQVEKVFGKIHIIQLDEYDDEFGFITNEETEGALKEKIALLSNSPGVYEIRNKIRVEQE